MSLNFETITVDYPAGDAREDSLRALDGLNLAIATGESVAIIGPSGCGKSTLLRLASGLMRPTSGRVLVDDEEVTAPEKGTALILQNYGLLPWKTVLANAELGLTIQKVARAERRERAQKALEAVGLGEFARSYPSELSGGMQQRLAVARAMAMDANLLLMDEPLSALDAIMREEIQGMLLDLWKTRGYTQVLVTHSIEEAVFLGSRIVVMAPRPGRIIANIDNPGMGKRSFRGEDGFFAKCREVRAALEAGGAAEASADAATEAVMSTSEPAKEA